MPSEVEDVNALIRTLFNSPDKAREPSPAELARVGNVTPVATLVEMSDYTGHLTQARTRAAEVLLAIATDETMSLATRARVWEGRAVGTVNIVRGTELPSPAAALGVLFTNPYVRVPQTVTYEIVELGRCVARSATDSPTRVLGTLAWVPFAVASGCNFSVGPVRGWLELALPAFEDLDMIEAYNLITSILEPGPNLDERLEQAEPRLLEAMARAFVRRANCLQGDRTARPWTVADLCALEPTEFERFVVDFLQALGLRVQHTGRSGDGGVDVVAVSDAPIVGGTILVQCKRFTDNVGEPAVRDLFGTLVHRQANKAILMTTANFTKPALDFAKGKPIEFVSGERLVELLAEHGFVRLEAGQWARRTSR